MGPYGITDKEFARGERFPAKDSSASFLPLPFPAGAERGFGAPHQFPGRDLENGREAQNRAERRIHKATLDHADVGTMIAAFQTQFLLR